MTEYNETTPRREKKRWISDPEGKLKAIEEAAPNYWTGILDDDDPVNESLAAIETGDSDVDFVIRLMKYPFVKRQIVFYALYEIYGKTMENIYNGRQLKKLEKDLAETKASIKNAGLIEKFKLKKKAKQINEKIMDIRNPGWRNRSWLD